MNLKYCDMDYKEKYEKAVQAAMLAKQDTESAVTIGILEEIFPELREPEDERIRKALLELVHDTTGDELWVDYNVHKEDAIAWIEKQGEHANFRNKIQIGDKVTRNEDGVLVNLSQLKRMAKPAENKGKNNMGISETTKKKLEDNLNKALEKETPESWNKFLDEQGEQKTTIEMKTPEESLGIDSDTYNKIVDECVYGEQKPTDKFHEGDWIIHQGTENIYQVVARIDNQYQLKYGDNYTIQKCADVDRCARLWDITKDAKDGDVLVSENPIYGLGTWYCIFKSLDDDESMKVHCYLARDGRFETKKELCFDKDPYNTKPATKEQRETLMKAMADAGYEWDADKKELKKIEQKPQSTWKPSDEQMNTLKSACGGNYVKLGILESLYVDLKKLREE